MAKFFIKFFNIHSKGGPQTLSTQEEQGVLASNTCSLFTRPKLRQLFSFPEFREAYFYFYEGVNDKTGVSWAQEAIESEKKIPAKNPEIIRDEMEKLFR